MRSLFGAFDCLLQIADDVGLRDRLANRVGDRPFTDDGVNGITM